MQRFFDVLFSGLAIVVLAPLMLPIMLILRLTGEGEIFYRQTRVGRGGEHFALLKFATMLKDSPNIGPGEITLKEDPRILPFGKFLRKTKLNELPQLINILKGDLSVVGPRPQVPNTFAQYPEAAKQDIGRVRPGLSGIGSIVFRDEERYLDNQEDPHTFYRETIIPYKADLERWYVRNQSLRVYFEVILLTVWVILFPSSRMPWRVWKDLPEPPEALRSAS
ncbi:lipid carrier : UDP-N-acetylgalactosaminyltransferase [Halorhodospira halochloris]|uniref:Lipid carrier: UDP-N-acetylgalactosaminyltransferase n=1 Tax=Halorhodospira halochloris TaxID=1052 RepID=A0A110B4T7_HALHR|nr:sugar transferase [Halorhodospira halochloris]MBK1652697.1 lipid carrier--UDP-N-acetylgalactosaminyltransferase [Halorhodospira halochloris]BAU57073.1 lipid carrier : UDP-N-acetylgalactosaminyltransferase [Halorhodospira halochloris]